MGWDNWLQAAEEALADLGASKIACLKPYNVHGMYVFYCQVKKDIVTFAVAEIERTQPEDDFKELVRDRFRRAQNHTGVEKNHANVCISTTTS